MKDSFLAPHVIVLGNGNDRQNMLRSKCNPNRHSYNPDLARSSSDSFRTIEVAQPKRRLLTKTKMQYETHQAQMPSNNLSCQNTSLDSHSATPEAAVSGMERHSLQWRHGVG